MPPKKKSKAVILSAGEGRLYDMGRIKSIFKADGKETGGRYSISEWWLNAKTSGPGVHSHAEDDIFFVIEGTMSILVDKKWVKASRGAFVLVPGGVPHNFENRSTKKAGILNFSIPGNFEAELPAIVEWFEQYPPKKLK